ncbi:MAG: MFS transporter [Erysipelothrix sp.]|nr:MFS transporter [Erysipelothrix sp.]
MNNKKNIVSIFLIINTFHAIINNMVHPVTPAFIHSLNIGNTVFGLAYAAMAFSNFVFSFFWGNWVNKYKIKNVYLLSLLGYTLGQLFFMSSTTTLQIVLARLFAGIFVSGFQVGAMAYIINQSEPTKRAKNLTFYSISNIVAATLGYLIGGQLGNYSVRITFLAQVMMLIFVTGMFYFFTNKYPMSRSIYQSKESMVTLLKQSKGLFNPILILLLIAIFLTSSGNVAFDQSFNYYIKDIFDFPPSYNGYLKVIIGLVTLLSNVFITFKLIQKGRLTLSMAILASVSTISALLAVVVNNMILFLVFALLFSSIVAILQPLDQHLVSSSQKDLNKSNQVMGIYNATKSLGMIVGALLSSLFYGVNPKGPFLVSAILFMIAAIILIKVDRKRSQ